jgi:[ribosomal protein S5]-alanine N-acetyltransferase
MTLEEAQERVGRRMRMEAEKGYAPLIIHTKETGRFIGSGGLQTVGPEATADVEVAYHYLPSEWGKGYATEAGRAILDFGFKTVKLAEIVGFVHPENVASWRVLEKIGMRYEGMSTYPGLNVPVKKYIARQNEWAAPQ